MPQDLGASSGSREPSPSSTGLGPTGFDPARLRELADECESADCPAAMKRGRDIMLASGWKMQRRGYFMGPLHAWHSPDNFWTFDDDDFHRNDPTRSLTYAKRILPRGTLWAVGSMEEGPFARLCWPMPNGGYGGGYVEAKGATAELALCAAAMRGQAIATEARRAETVQQGSVHEGAGPKGIAQTPCGGNH